MGCAILTVSRSTIIKFLKSGFTAIPSKRSELCSNAQNSNFIGGKSPDDLALKDWPILLLLRLYSYPCQRVLTLEVPAKRSVTKPQPLCTTPSHGSGSDCPLPAQLLLA